MLDTTHYFIMKTSNKRVLQEIEINQSSDTDFKDVTGICKMCITKSCSFLVNEKILHRMTLYDLEKFFQK